ASSIIFNKETATILNQARSRSIVVDLDKTDSVIIKVNSEGKKLKPYQSDDSELSNNLKSEESENSDSEIDILSLQSTNNETNSVPLPCLDNILLNDNTPEITNTPEQVGISDNSSL
ncbi:30723_t:CDS:2, partial [Racocetra persica]